MKRTAKFISSLKQVVIEFWMLPYQPREEKPMEEKFYFRVYTHTDQDIETDNDKKWMADEFLRDSGIVRKIMDEFEWDLNHDWEIISVIQKQHGQQGDFYTPIKSPEQLAAEVQVKKEAEELREFENNLRTFELTKKDIIFNDDTQQLEISVPILKTSLKIPPSAFYDLIKQHNAGVNIKLTNSLGQDILSLIHGSFLNAGLGDIMVYKPGVTAEQIEQAGFFGRHELEEGGIFIRDNGELHIGDIPRTKFLTINLAALIKELHIKGALLDPQKQLEFIQQLKIESPKQ